MIAEATTMPMKLTNVTFAPPNLSASFPPTGRISEPSSGPMNVIDAACSGVRPNWFCSTRPNAKL